MFARKNAKSLWTHIKEFIWPVMGWKRTIKYFWYRMSRLSDKTVKIALGLAIGSSVSFSPLMGTHFIQALLFAYFARANYLAAMAGTFWGNPWSFPFIWFAGYQLGSFIFSLFGAERFSELPEDLNFDVLWQIILDKPLSLFLPWMVGGYVCALIFFPFAFIAYYYIVKTAQAANRRRKLRNRNKSVRGFARTGRRKASKKDRGSELRSKDNSR